MPFPSDLNPEYNDPLELTAHKILAVLRGVSGAQVPVNTSGGGGGPTTYTPSTSVKTTSGTVASGMKHIEFILSTDFSGTINGADVSGASIGVYAIDAPVNGVFPAVSYTITTGSAILTTY